MERQRRAAFVGAAWLTTLAAAVALGWWGGTETLRPPDVEAEEAQPALYTVAEGTVGRTIPATATAVWQRDLVATQTASGTVTAVHVGPSDDVARGDALFEVDERPVIVSDGAVPSYRDMARDAEGEDVAQLQRLLTAEGFYDGPDDGDFGWGTERAVEAWQRSLGLDDDGVVRQGDVLFVADLPGRVLLADGIAVGRQVSPGGDAVFALSEAPTFTITLPEGQSGLVSPGVEVRVEHMDGTWHAQVVSIETNAQSQPVLTLQSPDGGPVCGDECAEQVPADVEESQFRADIVVVPETTGPLVPAAAIETGADGSVSVTTADGSEQKLQVVAVDAGQAVVEGVEVGDSIRLLSGSGGPHPGAEPDPDPGAGSPDGNGQDAEAPDEEQRADEGESGQGD